MTVVLILCIVAVFVCYLWALRDTRPTQDDGTWYVITWVDEDGKHASTLSTVKRDAVGFARSIREASKNTVQVTREVWRNEQCKSRQVIDLDVRC